MAEKVTYPQQPQGPAPPPGMVQPPPYMPNDPPPAYAPGAYGAPSGQPFPPNAVYPQMHPGAYQVPPQVMMGSTTVGGPPTVVTVVKVGQWGPYPVQVTCTHCNARVMTETSHKPGLLTWLISGALVFVGCWLGCCLIPCCIPECQDIEHHCPNCRAHLGTFVRI